MAGKRQSKLLSKDQPNHGQARLDHISARGKKAHDIEPSERSARRMKDASLFRETFGDEAADKDEAFAAKKRREKNKGKD